jgi:hypothetical protein
MARTFLVYQKAARQMVVNELLKHKDLPGIGELIEREKPAMRPVRIELKSTVNPFAGRKNELTPRQIAKKRRAFSFHKGK